MIDCLWLQTAEATALALDGAVEMVRFNPRSLQHHSASISFALQHHCASFLSLRSFCFTLLLCRPRSRTSSRAVARRCPRTRTSARRTSSLKASCNSWRSRRVKTHRRLLPAGSTRVSKLQRRIKSSKRLSSLLASHVTDPSYASPENMRLCTSTCRRSPYSSWSYSSSSTFFLTRFFLSFFFGGASGADSAHFIRLVTTALVAFRAATAATAASNSG